MGVFQKGGVPEGSSYVGVPIFAEGQGDPAGGFAREGCHALGAMLRVRCPMNWTGLHECADKATGKVSGLVSRRALGSLPNAHRM